MRTIIARQGQTIFDIAIQEYGCYEGISELMKLNPAFSLSHELTAGDVVSVHKDVPQLTPTNQAIATYFKANETKVNSSYVRTSGGVGNGYVNEGYVDDGYVN